MNNEVSVLIPSRFNNRWALELCLKSIRKYTSHPHRIIVGNAGMDNEALHYINSQSDVEVIDCPDHLRPKDTLARAVKTPYFMFLHDDAQVINKGWITKRLKLMNENYRNGIVGLTGDNYGKKGYTSKSLLSFFPLKKRFFPLVMLVKKEVQDELDLLWGIVGNGKAFDTGAIAYLQFLKQSYWKFVPCYFSQDVKHWGQMTWVMKEWKSQSLQEKRERKVQMIRDILKNSDY